MDPHEPPHSPHSHHLQLGNIRLVGPNPFTTTVSTTVMAPTSARLPLFSINDNSSPHSEPHVNNNMVPSILNPCVGASSGTGSMKRKRGRPRKYFLGVNTYSGLGSISGPTQALTVSSPSFSTDNKNNSGRGRPRDSFKKKQLIETLGVIGSGFSPHVIFVNQGEDIIAKVTTFSQEVAGPNTEICIMSAHGLVGIVALHQSGSIVNYEGQFEIVSLSGNLEVSDNNNGSIKMSYFKVCLVGHDSRPLVGVVANTLIASSLVKVTLGSFTMDSKKSSSDNLKYELSSVPSSQFASYGTPTNATSLGPSFESLGDNENNHSRQGPEIYSNTNQPIPSISMYQQLWAHQTQK